MHPHPCMHPCPVALRDAASDACVRRPAPSHLPALHARCVPAMDWHTTNTTRSQSPTAATHPWARRKKTGCQSDREAYWLRDAPVAAQQFKAPYTSRHLHPPPPRSASLRLRPPLCSPAPPLYLPPPVQHRCRPPPSLACLPSHLSQPLLAASPPLPSSLSSPALPRPAPRYALGLFSRAGASLQVAPVEGGKVGGWSVGPSPHVGQRSSPVGTLVLPAAAAAALLLLLLLPPPPPPPLQPPLQPPLPLA